MTTSEANRELVLASYRAFAEQDKDAMTAFFAPDAEWVVPQDNATVVALGQRSGFYGRDAILHYLTDSVNGRLFSEGTVDIQTVLADGDSVMIEQLYKARLCNGRPYEMVQVFIYKLRNGQIAQVRAFFDTKSGQQQIFGDEAPRKLV
ncbi:MAG TPA: nuclear transport factor 2 family protein [Caulobacteraceae bacterium]|jgi:hypothetical protein